MRLVTIATLLFAAPTLAQAADYLPPPPLGKLPGPVEEFNWGGLYGGIHVGIASGDFSASPLGRELSQIAYKNYTVAPRAVDFIHFGDSSRQTAGFGGFVGHNWTFDDAVVGLEAEYMRPRSKLLGSSSYDYAYLVAMDELDRWAVTANATSRASVTDYGVFKVRGGYAMGRFMPFAGIGLALGRVETSGSMSGTVRQDIRLANTDPWTIGATSPIGASIKKTGYAAGLALSAGLDYAPIDNVFLRAQYQYVGFADFKAQRINLNTISIGAGVKY